MTRTLLNLDAGLIALHAVIARLEETPPIRQDNHSETITARRREISRLVVEEGLSWSAASEELLHLDRPDAVEFVKSIQNDLSAQVKIFSDCVDASLRSGSHPPPGYTWRITVILRRAKLLDLERRFLAAYFKHFYSARGSSRDRDLGIRAIKVGVDIPAPPDSTPLPLPPPKRDE